MRWGRAFQNIGLVLMGLTIFGAGTSMAGPANEILVAPATMAEPLNEAAATPAIFELEETGLPFLGFGEGAEALVVIGVDSPGYQDHFTIYFARGSSALTLAGEDMVAMAAEAVLIYGEADIWISPGPSLTTELGFARSDQIHDVLLQSGIPGNWIRMDDGSLEAILERPAFLADGQDL